MHGFLDELHQAFLTLDIGQGPLDCLKAFFARVRRTSRFDSGAEQAGIRLSTRMMRLLQRWECRFASGFRPGQRIAAPGGAAEQPERGRIDQHHRGAFLLRAPDQRGRDALRDEQRQRDRQQDLPLKTARWQATKGKAAQR